ncbi:MAG TPA: hypothetical protein VJP77_03605 [Planctomycetota bacterium]|nr:hypothetical protein [Planctomycetota bacterium]
MSNNKYKFPDYILENREFLRKIVKTRSKNQFNNLLATANTDQILAITEIIHNILQGSVPLSRLKRTKLAKNADYYRKIAKSKNRKRAIENIQSGSGIGLLSAVLAPVLSILSQGILERALNK